MGQLIDPWRWTSLRGYTARAPHTAPEDLGLTANDVLLEQGTLGRRRPSLVNIDLTSGPSAVIHYLAAYRPSGTHLLFAFSSTATLAIHSWNGSSWTSQTVSDTAANPSYPSAVTFNNKLFMAYDSDVNRLHVYDGTSIRRVGLSKPSAPTVADTGTPGVALAAIARYYRIQFLIKSGSDIVAMSELSDAVSFTPDGGHTTARITKSTTVDSATHWRIYGVIGAQGDTYDLYEQVGSDTVIGTTTLDDITPTPASYSGTEPPQLGLNIPPPSAKYLSTDGNRLLMAGAWESSGSAGLTTPKNSRVWFTRVLGSSDLGDDESIPNTEDQFNKIDVGENDGDAIIGLSEPVDGIVYVFKTHHIYQLIPTGIDTLPYQAQRISNQIGLLSLYPTTHRTILAVGDAVYFDTMTGYHRISPTGGLEQVGYDITDTRGFGPTAIGAAWEDSNRLIVLVRPTGFIDVYNPEFARRTDYGGLRGGWTLWTSTGFTTPGSVLTYEVDGGVNIRYVFIGGVHNGSAKLQVYSSTSASDAGGTYAPLVTSHDHTIGSNISVQAPLLEATVQASASTVPTIGYVMSTWDERQAAAPSLAHATATRMAVRVDGLEGSDAYWIRAYVSWHTAQIGVVDALTIPLHPQERR